MATVLRVYLESRKIKYDIHKGWKIRLSYSFKKFLIFISDLISMYVCNYCTADRGAWEVLIAVVNG